LFFFGEDLPKSFSEGIDKHLGRNCDVMIVLGTSLKVSPFCMVPSCVEADCPRLLVNRELVGDFASDGGALGRDAVYLGDVDDGIRELSRELGWEHELDVLKNIGWKKFEDGTQ